MSARHVTILVSIFVSLIGGNVSAQSIAPSALLTIDQNRATVVERIVGEWADRLAMSNAGISPAQLRQILSGLRSDHLLAASLAGSAEGLRDVVSAALVRSDAAVSPTLMHTKSLGDTTDDLVYTPVVPCRIVDTRSGGGGVFLPGNQRDWLAFSPGGFAGQGGSATNCGIPVRPVAIMANTTMASGIFSTVAGGAGNTASATYSAVAGGSTNLASGVDSTVAGGDGNTASGPYSTVAGGSGNTASGDYSFVAGGARNTASSSYS